MWYRAYCFFMVVAHVVGYGGLVWFLRKMEPEFRASEGYDPVHFNVTVTLLIVVGVVFTVINLVAAFLPVKGWSWIGGLANLVLGVLSCFCLPFALPILIYWMRDDVRNYFGVNARSGGL